ncbi:MAG: hypothetical protein P8P74_11060 [Crocinitomicaceae bacterium]|nr:hypothetical protein [Crocinitomicaceae bacterium]
MDKNCFSYHAHLRWLTAIVLLFCFQNQLNAQQGRPFISNYPPVSYASNDYISSPQNWCVGEDNKGRIVVANTSGMLVYDGMAWQMISGTENKSLFKFSTDREGQIFTAGDGEIGVIKVGDKGELVFHSLLNELKAEDREFGKIFNVVSHDGAVYFRSSSHLIRYFNGSFKTWTSDTGKFIKLVSSSAGVFVSKKQNWYQIKGDDLQEIANSMNGDLPNWRAVFQGPGDSLLIATKNNGFYHLHDKNVSAIQNDFSKLTIKNGCQISEGEFALSTDEKGIIIVDRDGTVNHVIYEASGLSSNSAIFPYFNNGALWVAMNSGVSKIEYPLRTTLVDKANGLDNIPLSTLKIQDRLFIGTYSGAYWMKGQSDQNKLIRINDQEKSIFAAIELNKRLIASTADDGFIVINEDDDVFEVKNSSSGACYSIIPNSKSKNSVYVGYDNLIIPYEIG